MNKTSRLIPFSWVEKLFANMSMIYGNRMESMWKGMDSAQVLQFWHMKLEEMTPEEFTRGVKALDRHEYPPTLPQFIKLCRPDIDFTSAYYEAVKGVQARREGKKGEWSHPAIFWAASSMAFDLLNQSKSQVEGRWKEALSKQLEKSSWKEIPEVFVPLDRPENKITAEQARQNLDNLGVSHTLSKPSGEWVIRGFERMKNGWNPPPGVKSVYIDAAKAFGIKIDA